MRFSECWGRSFLELKEYDEAESLLQSAHQGLMGQIETIPKMERVRILLARQSLRRLYREWNKPRQANEIEKLLQQPLDLPEYAHGLAMEYFHLGDIWDAIDGTTDSALQFEEQITTLRGLVSKHPAVPRYRNALGACLNNYANFLVNTGQVNAAFKAYGESRSVYQELVTAEQVRGFVEFSFLDGRYGRGRYASVFSTELDRYVFLRSAMATVTGPPELCLVDMSLGLILSQARLGFFGVEEEEYSRELALAWMNIALLEKERGNLTATAIAFNEMDNVVFSDNPAARQLFLYNAGRLTVSLAEMVAKDVQLIETKRLKQSEEYSRTAVDLLRKSLLTFPSESPPFYGQPWIMMSADNLILLQKDRQLDPLRDRDDFKQLIKELKAAAEKEKQEQRQ